MERKNIVLHVQSIEGKPFKQTVAIEGSGDFNRVADLINAIHEFAEHKNLKFNVLTPIHFKCDKCNTSGDLYVTEFADHVHCAQCGQKLEVGFAPRDAKNNVLYAGAEAKSSEVGGRGI